MNIKVRINKIISCILVTVMVLSCMGNAAPALAESLASLQANDVPVVYAGEEALYTQDFTGVTDVTTVGATSYTSQDGLSISSDTTYTDSLEFDISKSSSNGGGRGARVRLGSADVSALTEYIVEFDAVIKSSTAAGSTFTVTGTDFRYNNGGGDSHMNTGAKSGYLLNLTSASAGTSYTIAGSGNVTIPSGEWCHYKLYVDKNSGNVSITITDADGEFIADKSIVAYDGAGNFEGFYVLAGKANGAAKWDNIVVRNVNESDEFGAAEEVTVSFVLNGHGEAIEDVTLLKGGIMDAFSAPLAAGYVFRGWFEDEGLTDAFNVATDAVEADMTLYAKWTADTAEDGSDAVYYQSFSGISDISTVVKSANNQVGVVLATDDAHGYYLSYSMSGVAANRGAYMDFTATTENTYVVEFDAAISPAETNKTEFVVKGSDYADTGVNAGGATGYILKLVNVAGGSTVYTINETETTVTIPSGEWCHYKLEVNKTSKTVTLSITGTTTANIADKVSVGFDSTTGDIAGMYLMLARATGTYLLDNVKVYNVINEEVTISFNLKGHGDEISPVTVTKGAKLTAPTAPTATGWTFGGWYTDAGLTAEYNFDTVVEDSFTLYAKWTEDSGSGEEDEPAESDVWTFGDSYLEVKGFDTNVLAETAIGTTGFKVATATSKTNYNNVLVRNNSSTNSGFYPRVTPEDVGYYLFLGAGGNGGTTTVTLTLPKTVPAGKAIKITFAKIEATNNGAVRTGAGNVIRIGNTALDLQNDFESTVWTTKTVVLESDLSAITVELGAWSAAGISKIEVTDAPVYDGTEYTVVADATGNSTAVDTSVLIYNNNVSGYRVTTSKDGKVVSQKIVEEAPTTVDSTGADKVEVAVVFYYTLGAPGDLSAGGTDIGLPAGTYDFVVYSKGTERGDVYVNSQMLVNNILQNGTTPNYFAVNDIVVTGSAFAISTSDYSSKGSADVQNIDVQVIPSSTIVNRVKKVYVLGDSLVAVYYNGANKNNNIRTGWGQVLADYLTDDVEVVDLANSGVTANGLYTTAFTQVLGSAKEGDILILESGYNDRTYDTEEVMKTAVTNMVNESKALGVDVVLVSPNASAKHLSESVAWASRMKDVATATGTTYVDLSKLSYDFLSTTYSSNTTVIYDNYNLPGDEDDLHSSYNGANKFASLVAGSLYEQGYESIVDANYVYVFVDTVGNVISCSATGKLAEGYVKVTFDMNGVEATDLYQVVETGSKVTKPATTPTATGYVFDGWYKDAACTTAWDFAADTVSETVCTIYAKWLQNAAGTLYTQNFTTVTDTTIGTIATAQNTAALKLANDATHGNFLSYDFTSVGGNSRGLEMDFTADTSTYDKYIVEFDAAITPGGNQNTCFTIKGTDFAWIGVNDGPKSGYLLNLDNKAGGSTTYTMNGTQEVTIPSGEWCHYVLYVDKTQGLITTTITGSATVADKVVTAYDGNGDVEGLYVRAGRYNPIISVDNILVREVGELDEFGEVVEETLSSAEFTSGLDKVITQPAEGAAVHYPIVIKGNGSLGGDLTDKVTVEWSVVGLDNEDGYISLTKASGTGAGTDGDAADGTTAYFNVRNGVSNYFGYVQAKVTCGEYSYTIRTPFAVLGASSKDANQIVPAGGYPACMDDYADSLVNYVGTANTLNGKDIVLNNWSIYGSNGARTLKLVEVDGKKAIEFAANGGSGTTVAVYQWTDQSSQYVIDFTAKFTADMAFGVYGNTPNNTGNNPEWAISYSGGALTLGTESITGVNANAWYRIVVTADPSVQKVGVTVYDSTGAEVGSISDIDMTYPDTNQKYFCFYGTWPMYLNTFKAYKPALESIVVGSNADAVRVPEAGGEAATVDFSAVLTSNSGVTMTGAVEWSLAEDYANVELVSTGAQTATLTIYEGASGTITVIATKDGKQGEKTIQLTTSSNVVAFSESASSITIPFTGQDAVVANFVAVTRNGEGEEIDGGAITYALLAKDGVTETTVRGVNFENGVLTVAAGAAPAVVYVKATNAEGLSTTVKVNIHGLSFAFGSADAADGYTQVIDTLYTAKLGYGFANTDGLTINSGNVTGTSDFRFKATVPNGNYTVKVVTSAASMTSEVVESVSAVTGIPKTGTSFSVAVCDGVLDLTFPANSTVTTIEISQATAKTALEKPMIYAIGDSTTKNNASGALSWGNCVADGKVIVPSAFSGFANHGMAGRDSVNYYNQGRVETVLLAICPGDYVTVNMGINSSESGEAASYYTLLSEYYVEGIIQRGGIPVIVTATPDGPVGDRVASNYDSTTGKFTNSRGTGARNDVLRQIATEKNLNIIELGQWGEDWMNTLTAADVTAYNSANGTSYTTVLEMVQSWYVDHNHYKEYLGIQIGEYLLGELKNLAVEKESIIFDFQNETTPNWEMTGDLSSAISIVDDSAVAGNKYLQLSKKEARTTTTTRVFADMPKMTEAEVAFKWYFGEQTSTSRAGFTGIKFMAGETELVALYFGELRADGDTSSIYYSNAGFDAKVESGVKVSKGNWYDVSLEFDFANDTAAVYIGGSKVVSGLALEAVVQNVDGLAFVTFDPNGGTKVTANMGIDDVSISYIEKTAEDDVVTIYSLGKIDNVVVTDTEYKAGYTHPTSVTATLTNGETITVEIDADTWMCLDFDEKTKGAYTWTAEIIAPAEYANTKNLEATYVMEYSTSATSSKYDYYNDFTFESDMIPSIAWGKGMDSLSGSGGFTLTYATEANGNGYLNANVTGNGDRGSRLDLDGGIVKGATFTFDWMPINNNGSANGQIMFVSNASWHSYFTLRFDTDYNITAFTENPLGSCSTTQEPFEGSIGAANPIDTGLGGQNTWFTVSVTFDYLAHTADLTITEKANPSNTFTKNNIPIDTAANGTRAMVIHMSKLKNGANVTMGLDNIAIDYDKFDGGDIVKITNPADVAVAKVEYSDFTFPTTVKVGLGDGSSVNLLVKKWTATPTFDKNVSAEYVWTAELVLRDYTNHFDLQPSFTMIYTQLPYPTYVYNPATLELEYGDALPTEFPTTVIAHMSNGEIGTVEVGEWTPIREFNANKEGIYVYGANIVAKEGAYDVVESKLAVNENPEDPSAQRADYVYDVYYRISYFESEDNYNAYERSMEYLDRGVYAVKGKGGIFVSWRLLVHEYGKDIAFNIYRNGVLVNSSPITDKTNYIDAAGKAGDIYTVAKIQDGKLYESEEVVALSSNYMTIPMQKPEPQPDKNGVLSTYTMNDAGTADVDGDGQYEIIIKWYPSDAFDSGSAVEPSAPTIFDVYEMDGTPLWRLNLGLEMPSGAHFNPFMLYDLDEDGKAELFLKTSDGTVSYKPNANGKFDMTDESTIVSYIGDKKVVPGTNINQNGHAASSTNEYVTVFNGMTGEEIDTIDFINVTGDYADWGKDGDGGNRSARYNIAIAYLPEDQNNANCTDTIPAVLYNRGYYNKTTVAAYTLRDGKINLDWNFVTASGTEYAGKGNHNMSTGDVDKDGFDELVIGAMAIDHDGSVLWVKNGKDGQDYAGHADSIHLAAMNPNKKDLYVFTPQEEQVSTLNYALVNAGTGTRWLGEWFTKKDVGRGVAANITPRPGYESWAAASGSGLYAFDGSVISKSKNVPMNWVLYWDGDLLSELADGSGAEGNTVISKYNWNTDKLDTLATLSGTKMCNWTKNTPSLTADLFGDWREEVVVRNSDDTELRIYMTTTKTDYMIYTLMHDPVYRNSVANQNTSYNQPSHVGIYLGEDQRDVVLNMQLDTANVVYTVQEVGEEIKDAIEDATAEEIIENIENDTIDIDEMADAMQNNEEVLDKVSEIENEFVEDNGIEVLAPVVEHKDMSTTDIKETVGVGLNAEQADSTIGLVFEKTPKEDEKPVNENAYANATQIDITLECDGVPIEGKLKVPVTITMKIPKGLNSNGIWIFHYHGDDMDIIRPRVNMDGTITFSVSSFSTFVFTNKAVKTQANSGDSDDSDDYYYVDSDANNRAYAERNWNGQEGWQKINGEWYYFDANGKLVIGWVLAKDGRWYYMNNDGKMATKWVLSPESKIWYYMDPTNGHMLSNGWLCDPDSQRWYYLDPNGAMCTSWIIVDNIWYLLDKNGAMCTGWNLVDNKWYLLGINGAMLTGWQTVGGKQYYMLPSGECLLNTTTPDGHKVNANGEKID